MNSVEEALQVEVRSITYWTDSSVVLAWIKRESAGWKTFVANRVKQKTKIGNMSLLKKTQLI